MNMKMNILAVLPSKIQNKAKTRFELQRYFGAKSIESLIIILQRGQSNGYFTFDVTLSPEYYAQQRDKYDVLSGKTDSYTPTEFLGMAAYGLRKETNKPLTKAEVREFISDSSSDMTEQYLLFTLRNIDYKKLGEIVRPKSKQTDKDEDYDRVEYRGLVAQGASITYLNSPIYMSFQHRQVVRLLLSRNGELCTKDMFTGNVDIFTRDHYPDIFATLRKLIAEVRAELKMVTKNNCIKPVQKDGWYLDL
jgi:hypothetical protein